MDFLPQDVAVHVLMIYTGLIIITVLIISIIYIIRRNAQAINPQELSGNGEAFFALFDLTVQGDQMQDRHVD